MTFNWIPLTKWQRFVRFFSYYLCPWRPCMTCGKRFFNPDFWRWFSIRWGVPEYCSKECWNAELDGIVEESYFDDDGNCIVCGWTCPGCGCCRCNGCDICRECDCSECDCVCNDEPDYCDHDPYEVHGNEN